MYNYKLFAFLKDGSTIPLNGIEQHRMTSACRAESFSKAFILDYLKKYDKDHWPQRFILRNPDIFYTATMYPPNYYWIYTHEMYSICVTNLEWNLVDTEYYANTLSSAKSKATRSASMYGKFKQIKATLTDPNKNKYYRFFSYGKATNPWNIEIPLPQKPDNIKVFDSCVDCGKPVQIGNSDNPCVDITGYRKKRTICPECEKLHAEIFPQI